MVSKRTGLRRGCTSNRRKDGVIADSDVPQNFDVIEVPFQVGGKRKCWWKATVIAVENEEDKITAEIEFHGKGNYENERWEIRFVEEHGFVRIDGNASTERHMWRNEGDRTITLPDEVYENVVSGTVHEGVDDVVTGDRNAESGKTGLGGTYDSYSGDLGRDAESERGTGLECIVRSTAVEEGNKLHREDTVKAEMGNIWKVISGMKRDIIMCKAEGENKKRAEVVSYLISLLRMRLLKKCQESIVFTVNSNGNEFSRTVCRGEVVIECDCSYNMFLELMGHTHELFSKTESLQSNIAYVPSYLELIRGNIGKARQGAIIVDSDGLFKLLHITSEEDKGMILMKKQTRNGIQLCRLVGGGQWDEYDVSTPMAVYCGSSCQRSISYGERNGGSMAGKVLYRSSCAWDREMNYFASTLQKRSNVWDGITDSDGNMNVSNAFSNIHGFKLEWTQMDMPSCRKWSSTSMQTAGHVLGKCLLIVPTITFNGNRICEEVSSHFYDS